MTRLNLEIYMDDCIINKKFDKISELEIYLDDNDVKTKLDKEIRKDLKKIILTFGKSKCFENYYGHYQNIKKFVILEIENGRINLLILPLSKERGKNEN